MMKTAELNASPISTPPSCITNEQKENKTEKVALEALIHKNEQTIERLQKENDRLRAKIGGVLQENSLYDRRKFNLSSEIFDLLVAEDQYIEWDAEKIGDAIQTVIETIYKEELLSFVPIESIFSEIKERKPYLVKKSSYPEVYTLLFKEE